jgi:hypothetical protein
VVVDRSRDGFDGVDNHRPRFAPDMAGCPTIAG